MLLSLIPQAMNINTKNTKISHKLKETKVKQKATKSIQKEITKAKGRIKIKKLIIVIIIIIKPYIIL